MTQDEHDAGIGRLTRRCAQNESRIAATRARLDEIASAANRTHMNLEFDPRNVSPADLRLLADLPAVLGDYNAFNNDKAKMEKCLRQAGLADLIKKDAC